MRRPTRDDAQAALWTMRCLVRYRWQERRRRVEEIEFPPATRIGASGGRAVGRILRRRDDRCLSNALIAQAWRADHGDDVDVVLGVTSPGAAFTAHAWLADGGEHAAAGHEPIGRIAPHRRRGEP